MPLKRIAFLGDSVDRLRAFPDEARRAAGYQLDRVQRGHEPDDWKPLPTVGKGVREIRIRDAAGAFRVIYLATRPEAVYVLHAFQKRTRATPGRDLVLAAARLRALLRSLPQRWPRHSIASGTRLWTIRPRRLAFACARS